MVKGRPCKYRGIVTPWLTMHARTLQLKMPYPCCELLQQPAWDQAVRALSRTESHSHVRRDQVTRSEKQHSHFLCHVVS